MELSKEKKIGLVSLLFLFAIILSVLLYPASNYSNNPILQEFHTELSTNSIYLDSENIISTTNLSSRVYNSTLSDALKGYMNEIDKYGEYFNQSEYSAFIEAMQLDYTGIGMLLYQQRNSDRILCIPIKDKLLKMGLEPYDQLIAVDGKSVKNKNVFLVSSWIRGKKGSDVSIEIKKSSTQRNIMTIKREEQYFNSLQWIQDNGISMLHIVSFTQETPNELTKAIELWPEDIPVIIDLRDNGGGDFMAAINSADLFLPKGTRICSIQTREKQIEYYANMSDILNDRPLILLQNSLTASAAEVFISALTQNFRAKSVGEKSYGKGVVQKFIELSDGSAIYLTYARIITPNGESYDKKGLNNTSKLTVKDLLNEFIEQKISN